MTEESMTTENVRVCDGGPLDGTMLPDEGECLLKTVPMPSDSRGIRLHQYWAWPAGHYQYRGEK